MMSEKATEKKIGLPQASVAKQRDENRSKQHFVNGMSRQSHLGKSLETSTMITQQATLDREDQDQGLIDTAVKVPEKPTLECHSAISKPSSKNVSPLGAESIVQIHTVTTTPTIDSHQYAHAFATDSERERRITTGLSEELDQDMCNNNIMTTANGVWFMVHVFMYSMHANEGYCKKASCEPFL